MTGEIDLIRDLAVVMVTAAATTILAQRLRVPVVLGYLVAGLLVGPHLFPRPLISEAENVALLAELGVLFILFGLGMDFHLPKLKRVGPLALASGVLEMGIMIGMGILVANLFGWRSIDALFLGAILAISSTTIIVKVLEELGLRRSPMAQTIFGILLVEDLVAVILIALLSSLAITGEFTATTLLSLAGRITLFVVFTLVAGLVFVPRLLDRIARKHLEETLTITALGVAFAMSLVAIFLGLSVALGAFIAGAVVAEAKSSAIIERRMLPLRDMFTAIFFVSTGVLISPIDIMAYWIPIVILTVVSIVGKISAVSLSTFVAGYPPKEAMRVGIGMAMVGEFSFIIAGLGRDLGVTADFLFPIAVSVSALTTFITPNLIRNSDSIVTGLGRLIPRTARGYIRMYTSWVGRRRPVGGPGIASVIDLRAVARVVAYGLLLAAVGVAGSFVGDAAQQAYGETLWISGDVVVYTWGTLAIFALPVVYGFVQSVRAMVSEIVYAVIPPAASLGGQGAAAAAVMRRTLYVFFAIIASAVVVAAGGVFVPPLPLLVAASLVVFATAWALWGSLRRFNDQVVEAVDAVFVRDASPATRDQVLALIRERSPWEVSIETFFIPEGSFGAHKRLRDIGLPQKTGAAIVTHERDGVHTVNPSPDLRLAPGDAVGLVGETDQVADAKRLLVSEEADRVRPRGTTEAEVEVAEIEISSESRIAGLTLAGSRIRETTGASVVGLRRDGMPILNPAPVTRLRPGDAVVVLGSPEQVAAAKRLLAPTPEDERSSP